jgi:hypothetical protein
LQAISLKVLEEEPRPKEHGNQKQPGGGSNLFVGKGGLRDRQKILNRKESPDEKEDVLTDWARYSNKNCWLFQQVDSGQERPISGDKKRHRELSLQNKS